jgi:hypothetical protein
MILDACRDNPFRGAEADAAQNSEDHHAPLTFISEVHQDDIRTVLPGPARNIMRFDVVHSERDESAVPAVLSSAPSWMRGKHI